MLIAKTLTLWLVGLGVLVPDAAGQSAPVVAVFLIENRGTDLSQEDLTVLSDYLGTRLGEGGRYLVVPREEIRKRLTEQKVSSHKACFDQSCQIEIGRELAAQYTVSASIGRVGSQCIITAAIYDLKKAATFKTGSAKATCDKDALVGAVDRVAAKLRGETPAAEVQAPAPAPALPPRKVKRKSVWLAGVLSILPGGGMFYVGKWGYGILYACLIVGGVGASFQDENQELKVGLWVIAGSALAGSLVHAMLAAADTQDQKEPQAFFRRSVLAASADAGRDPHPAFILPLFFGSF